ncbi:MAG: signal peptidase I [Lachnospiraceae bacterium]|nr:signal peptidase I [Lachnospiraceae bacterium]
MSEEPGKEPVSGSKKALGAVLELLVYAAVVLSLTFLIVNYVGQRTMVSGQSMYPMLENGDQLLVDKISYVFTKPQRFDIVVFRYLYKENTYYIKRVIGLPGETVQITDGTIYINGEVLEENYGYEPIREAKRASEPILLGEDEYFVLGDNRNDSSDSRDVAVANVSRDQIIGKAFVRIWPLNHLTIIRHQ